MIKMLQKFFKKTIVYQTLGDKEGTTEIENSSFGFDTVNVGDSLERQKFVEGCLEQMQEATTEIQRLQDEYRLVNSYLHDMEEIEALPAEQMRPLKEHAEALCILNGDRKQYAERGNHMSESDFRKIERIEDVVEEGIRKIEDAEQYQEKIRKDMQRLEGEKHACKYRMDEASLCLLNMRGMAFICTVAVLSCFVILLLLEMLFDYDVKIGYLITAVITAIALTFMFLRYKDADVEYQVAASSLNKVILLQNKVKIRYVNNTNLLEYLFVRYHVDSGKQLQNLWKLYKEEKDERIKLEQTKLDLDFHSAQMLKQLKNYHLFDPYIWLHQPRAIVDAKEMVEVRHDLITRRQSLRKQMEYNTENGNLFKEKISEFVKKYPRYATEIMNYVERFEKRSMVDR